MKKTFLFIILLILILGVTSGAKNSKLNQRKEIPVNTSVIDDKSIVENYVRENISKLSPEKEVLGGTFYVTYIEVNYGSGVVAYEDGHIALTADFTYIIDSSGLPNITSFRSRVQ